VVLYDVAERSVGLVNDGVMPFDEPGAAEVLPAVLASGHLRATSSPEAVAEAEHVIVVIGTPIDEHLNPDLNAVPEAIAAVASSLHDGQLLVLRSTVYPGVTALVERLITDLGLDIDVAFCPERIAEGRAMVELRSLPQIVSSHTERGRRRAAELFSRLTDDLVFVTPEEAELAKLFTNTWRYIKFAASNQLYMMANDFGLDYERIRTALAHNYPRASDLPRAGFAAGPCLFKDTMQLAAFNTNNFNLGQASVSINEGLPLYVVARLEQRYDLSNMCVGVLGMSFKAESDDIRSSLSYKLKRILKFKSRRVLTHDPYVTTDPDLVDLDTVVREADLLVIGAPHACYRDLDLSVPVVDIWNLRDGGVQV
jgi:UDP-N-acetyl-D-mannosaminuronic acid dehydrogenase